MRAWTAAVVAAGLIGSSGIVAGAGGKPESAFHIDRNKNRNQVHYGVHVDAQCHPSGDAPVYNYWLRLEDTPPTTRPLSLLQQGAYGFQSQKVRGDGRIEVRLRALPERLLTIRTAPVAEGCKSETFLTIDGTEAYLDKIFVFADEGILLPDVRYIELYGHTNDGHSVYEKISPNE